MQVKVLKIEIKGDCVCKDKVWLEAGDPPYLVTERSTREGRITSRFHHSIDHEDRIDHDSILDVYPMYPWLD